MNSTQNRDEPAQRKASVAEERTMGRFKGLADQFDRMERWIPPDFNEFWKKYQRHIFVIAAFVLLILLLILGIVLLVLGKDDGASIFNLCVDIFVGIFAVWALFWAASEFAEAQVRPKLKLVLGKKVNGGCKPLPNPPIRLSGKIIANRGKKLEVCLWLENGKRKIARLARVEIKLQAPPSNDRAFPTPSTYRFYPRTFHPSHYHYKGTDHYLVVLQYKEDLIPYHTSNFLGVLSVVWENEQTSPKDVEFGYRIYNLDGPPDRGKIPAEIDWPEKEPDLTSVNHNDETDLRNINEPSKRSPLPFLTTLATLGAGVIIWRLVDALRERIGGNE
jgi:hypothetical protein